ncbi:MAG: hypothetical protein OXH70_17255 [Acidobacteria bacterium]|nr:hypothetical protein [Acidobacteriota bacterium]
MMPIDRMSQAIHQIWFPPPSRWPKPKPSKPQPPPPLTPEQMPEAVIAAVLNEYDISMATLLSRVCWTPVREARIEAVVRLRHTSRLSSAEIGKLLDRSASNVNCILRRHARTAA